MTMFVMTPSGRRMSPVSTVPKVKMDVTVSVVRFGERMSVLVDVWSMALISSSSSVSLTFTEMTWLVIAFARPFRIAKAFALSGA